MTGKKDSGPLRLVEPMFGLTDVLLGLMDGGDPPALSSGDDTPVSASPVPVLRVRMPGGRVEPEELLGGFLRRDRSGGFGSPRVVALHRATLHHGAAARAMHKLYRVRDGVAAYAGTLAAGGMRAFTRAAPGGEFRYRNAVLRRMTSAEIAAAVDPDLVYAFDLLGGAE